MRLTALFLLACFASAQTTIQSGSPKVDFLKTVQPLLKEKCYSCHSADVQQGGLRLDRRQLALRGGDYGPVIIPGKSSESKLMRRIKNGDGGLQMPPTGPLLDDEIAILGAWIDQGADFELEVAEAPPQPVNPKLQGLIAAVREGRITEVERLLAANPGLVKERDALGSTPLHHAAGFGTIAEMKLLLDKGADVNAANRRKSTPLFWGIHDPARVAMLIDRGANVNARTVDGRTPAHNAALLGDGTGILKRLLRAGADPGAKTMNGMTVLMYASSRPNLDSMSLLLESKVDVNARNGAGETALLEASKTGNSRALRMLLDKGADPKLRTKRNETALAWAVSAGVEESVKLLLDKGAEVNVADIRGYTPLVYAGGSDTKPAGIVNMLLAKGADRNARGDGETAAMLAAKRGDPRFTGLFGEAVEEPKTTARNVFTASQRSPREAVRQGLALLEKQSANFIRIGGCDSCHAQDLPSAAAALARERGLPAPASIPRLPRNLHANTQERLMDFNTVVLSGSALPWELFDFGMNRVPRDQYTDSIVRYLRAVQTPAGNWNVIPNRRPPMNTGDFQNTALAIYSFRQYGRPVDAAENAAAIARATQWLERNQPTNQQDRAFRLLGLAWGGGNPRAIAAAAKELASLQRDDGGWSQMETLESDAYATGQVMYALNTAGKMSATDPVYQRGAAYLLRTQEADGSWHVKSRSIWVQPYFDSGFPHGNDQWISGAGTAWAAMALSASADSSPVSPTLARRE